MSTVDQDKMVMEVQKNATQRVRISHRWYKGRQYIDVRLVVVDMAGEFVPTRQGIMLRPELLGQVIQGLSLAAREVA
ncbi:MULTISPECIES: transcriptional coactivator p15/PC4 family protein [unclassified Caballeronia]|uniref:transcriptional coactivator p15/PC4 family protein n=1 Tax=unclassified Caballeronia TaxID=2646786 RepID=UPI00285925D8|nr:MULTISPECIES: transcriptional coactivator p15/PC4 family protein [unclassified Caballeronia]MDR5772904.1 transcriptional coactivator p15/PC4 family protein [Caballeronia sp. LZ002]MDR5803633.1 transcriptional coactivator p15/PC4 family protein [Caballeronia sp. LZ001]MDR5848338.1 transcriptional coactivator p15/PC4 family protein [Caballeronia sp. LZ003]